MSHKRSVALMCGACGKSHFKRPDRWFNFSKCKYCGSFLKTPFPSNEELSALYEKAWQDPMARVNETGGTDEKIARQLITVFSEAMPAGSFKGVRVLDYGAGKGSLAKGLRHLGAEVVCLEPYGYEKLESDGFVTLRNIGQISDQLRFDVVIMTDVLEHIFDPMEELKRLASLLNENGRIIVTTPNASGLNSLCLGSWWRERRNPVHLLIFSRKGLELMVRRMGWRCGALSGKITYSATGLRRFLLTWTQKTGLDGSLRYVIHPSKDCKDPAVTDF